MQILAFMQTNKMQIRVPILPEFRWQRKAVEEEEEEENSACLALVHMHLWIQDKMAINSSASGLDFKLKIYWQKWRVFLRSYWVYSAEGKHSYCKEDEHNLLKVL